MRTFCAPLCPTPASGADEPFSSPSSKYGTYKVVKARLSLDFRQTSFTYFKLFPLHIFRVVPSALGSGRLACVLCVASLVQGYLAYKKAHPPRILP